MKKFHYIVVDISNNRVTRETLIEADILAGDKPVEKAQTYFGELDANERIFVKLGNQK